MSNFSNGAVQSQRPKCPTIYAVFTLEGSNNIDGLDDQKKKVFRSICIAGLTSEVTAILLGIDEKIVWYDIEYSKFLIIDYFNRRYEQVSETSIDEPIPGVEDITFEDTLEAGPLDQPDEKMARNEQEDNIKRFHKKIKEELIPTLKGNEKDVFTLYFNPKSRTIV